MWRQPGVTLLVGLTLSAALFLGLDLLGTGGKTEASLSSSAGYLPYYGIPNIVDLGLVGATAAGYGEPEEAYRVAWDSICATVPEGKKWLIIVSPGEQFSHAGKVRENWRGYDLSLIGVFKEGDTEYHGQLPAGEYEHLDLYIYNTMRIFAAEPADDGWAQAPVTYLILQVDDI